MKKNKKFDPFENLVLDEYEQEIEDSINRGDYVETENLDEVKKMFRDAVLRTQELRKSKRVTLRIKNEDLIKVKAKAVRNNVPYQRIINALIHQYAEGRMQLVL